MKKVFVCISLLFLTFFAKAQVVSVNDGTVVVKDGNGNRIALSSYSNLNDAIGGNGFVVLWFKDGTVAVKDQNLNTTYGTSNYSDLKRVSTSGNNVVLQFNDSSTVIMDKKLNVISRQ